MFATHAVKDYDAWEAVYKSLSEMHVDFKVVASDVYRGVEDPNSMTVHHEFAT